MNDDASKILEQFTKIMSDGGVDRDPGRRGRTVEQLRRRGVRPPRVARRTSASSAADVFTNHATKLTVLPRRRRHGAGQRDHQVERRQDGASPTCPRHRRRPTSSRDSWPAPPPTTRRRRTLQTPAHRRGRQGHIAAVEPHRTRKASSRRTGRSGRSCARTSRRCAATTIGDLDDIDLHDLEDPGWFDSFCEAAFEVVKCVYNVTGLEDLVDLIDAIAHGDWARAPVGLARPARQADRDPVDRRAVRLPGAVPGDPRARRGQARRRRDPLRDEHGEPRHRPADLAHRPGLRRPRRGTRRQGLQGGHRGDAPRQAGHRAGQGTAVRRRCRTLPRPLRRSAHCAARSAAPSSCCGATTSSRTRRPSSAATGRRGTSSGPAT